VIQHFAYLTMETWGSTCYVVWKKATCLVFRVQKRGEFLLEVR